MFVILVILEIEMGLLFIWIFRFEISLGIIERDCVLKNINRVIFYVNFYICNLNVVFLRSFIRENGV